VAASLVVRALITGAMVFSTVGAFTIVAGATTAFAFCFRIVIHFFIGSESKCAA